MSVDRTRDLQIFSLTLSQLSYPRCLLITFLFRYLYVGSVIIFDKASGLLFWCEWRAAAASQIPRICGNFYQNLSFPLWLEVMTSSLTFVPPDQTPREEHSKRICGFNGSFNNCTIKGNKVFHPQQQQPKKWKRKKRNKIFFLSIC